MIYENSIQIFLRERLYKSIVKNIPYTENSQNAHIMQSVETILINLRQWAKKNSIQGNNRGTFFCWSLTFTDKMPYIFKTIHALSQRHTHQNKQVTENIMCECDRYPFRMSSAVSSNVSSIVSL